MSVGRIVVTGADGFVGRHVVAAARARGLEVIGITRDPLADDPLRDQLVETVAADLAEGWPEVTGDAVIHLAGLAAVGPSFDHPQRYIETNSAIVTHIGEWLRATAARSGRPTRLLGVSSGAVYAGGDDGPLDEAAPTAPTSPYVVSKLLVENQLEYYTSRGLDVVVARPFNHIGPGQGPGFLVPDLLERLRALAPGESLTTGDLGTARDYTDVRDVAAAYLDLATAPRLGHRVFNVASGAARTGTEILAEVAAALGRPVPPTVVDPARVRPGETRRIVGDAGRLTREVGWRPRIPLATSIRDAAGVRAAE